MAETEVLLETASESNEANSTESATVTHFFSKENEK